MPLIRVNQREDGLELHRSPAPALRTLRRAAQTGSGPVIVMVHGFKFLPGAGRDCPHEHIFSMDQAPCWKARSWPRALGFGTGCIDEGLGLAFGWNAGGRIWNAYSEAARAGVVLAAAVRSLRAAAPDRAVHVIGHSLGARVALQALPHLAPGDMGRIIALNPAEFRDAAKAALDTPAGRAAELIAVRGRENAGYDLLLERLVAPERRGDRAMGWGLAQGPGRLMLRLEKPEVTAHLARLGYPLAPQRRFLCHWSPYLRGGTMTLYAALMRQAAQLPLDLLAPPEMGPATGAAAGHPLPWGRKAPS